VAPGSRNDSATVVQPPDVAALIALVDRLQAENRDLAAAAAVWQERAQVLNDRLLALEAPKEPPAASPASPDASTAAQDLEPSTGA